MSQKVIFKYNIGNPIIWLPLGAIILSVGVQQDIGGEALVIWALVERHSLKEVKRRFTVYGTGWDIPDDCGKYIGTVQTASGFVWHIYDEGEVNENRL